MEKHSDQIARIRGIVERCLRSVLPEGTALPAEDVDWIESGLLDSMGRVDVLVCVEAAVKSPNLFESASAPPKTIRATVEAIQASEVKRLKDQPQVGTARTVSGSHGPNQVEILGWGASLGSERIGVDKVEREFDLPSGTLAKRAGIESVCRVLPDENELSLATVAAEKALQIAGVSARRLDWILAAGETHLALPSLAASLHTSLLAPGTCRVLDIGGACTGVVNCLAVAQALFADDRAGCILVVSADVHSRIFIPGRGPGEFGGLFGDGASAFVLRRSDRARDDSGYGIATTIGGCAGTFSSALRVRPGIEAIELDFDGEALALAAVDQMEKIIADLEAITGVAREKASAFAIHQPNPRIVEMILRRSKLDSKKVPLVAGASGNLGSSTCGVALSMVLDEHGKKPRSDRGPILVAAVGPGMLWAGALLD